jgi:triphosphatase
LVSPDANGRFLLQFEVTGVNHLFGFAWRRPPGALQSGLYDARWTVQNHAVAAVSEPLETELKLELAPSEQTRLNLAGLSAIPEGRAKSLISTYYDTPDQQLRKGGYSLRVRESGGRYVQTVKAQPNAASGFFVRPEWEQEISHARPDPGEMGPLTQDLGADVLKGLGRAFVTEIERKVHKVQMGGAIIAIADDSGEIRAGRHAEPIREVELELEAGDPRALFMLARKIGDEVPVRLGVRSKSERGYQLLDRRGGKAFKSEPVALDPEDPTDVAFERIAHSCIRQFRLNETLLLASGKPEPLHQARVGLRRLRSAFSIFGALFQGDDRAQLLRAELRWLSVELGQVRDLDVLMESLSGSEKRAVADLRDTAFTHAMVEVDSARTRLLMLDLSEWLAFGDWRQTPPKPELVQRPIGETAAEILTKRAKKFKRHGRKLKSLSDEDRHELRKEGKKLRYASEFFARLYRQEPAWSEHKAFLGKLETLQDHLGELNDLATFPELLARVGITDVALGEGAGDRDTLLHNADGAYHDLIAVKRFWRDD